MTQEISIQEARNRLKAAKKVTDSGDALDFGTRQKNPPEEGVFNRNQMSRYKLIPPPYDPFKLYRIVESSTMLGSCIETMIHNINGFGHELQYLGKKENMKDEEVMAEKTDIENFFKRVNETQSFKSLRKELWRDFENTGNAYIEVIRYPDNTLATMYRADSRYIRLQAKQKESQEVTVNLTRNGKVRKTKIQRRFRRFAMVTNTGNYNIRWFKEYGDPRKMCAITGKYEDELSAGETIQELASEIIHLKQGNDTYGVPRWVGVSSAVLGVRDADFVNYNLFDTNAIPPLAILVSGGRLTSDSIDDIIDILESRKGKENYHKIAVLEAVAGDAENLDDKATGTKIDFKPLSQQSDMLFQNYVESSEKRIRSKFRLPALYLGVAEEYSRSTSDSSKLVAEEQVFRPERNDFDELINFTIMDDLGAKNWAYRTTGPKLIEGNEAIDAIGKFSRAGALSINQGIKVMNRVLDLDAPTFDDEWADYPAAMVLELSKRGCLRGIGEISTVSEKLADKIEKAKEENTLSEDVLYMMEEIKQQIDDIHNYALEGEIDFS